MAVKSLVFLRDRNWDLNRCKKMRALKSLQKEKSLSIHRGGQIARDFFKYNKIVNNELKFWKIISYIVLDTLIILYFINTAQL